MTSTGEIMGRDRVKNRDWQRRYYANGFREKRLAKYTECKANGICTNCGKRPKSETSLRCGLCNEIVRRGANAYHYRVRTAAFEAYGGLVCNCCGITELAFLSLDHVNDDGSAHRRKIEAEAGSNSIYVWLKKHNYPPGFQVLCMNCNMGRHRNGGICPHKKEEKN